MIMTMFIMLISMIISMGLMLACAVISKKNINDREKMSPFECGFDPQSSSRVPFSIQFFMIAILFLIFDVEIAIILPMIITIKSNIIWWSFTSTSFITILMAGLIHEWKNNILKWTD
uniref:NADH-ubiquinone oxidoreductase chain 3 n=1 Tax=Micronecta sahlbergii TaxID=2304347 RepID=A0A346LZK4_9HEMI|nr:NADH dehydrogenase subunit 3 [Micronecta sahlbergii]AXQ02199.1 NADH dehydrogenase subunit 3 [Micronecta sahlbergii]